jgi:hypothetical protein
LSGIRILAHVDQRIVGPLFRLLDRILEPAVVFVAAVELTDEIQPFPLAARNLIEVLFHFRRERDVDEIAEMRHQQRCDGKRGKAWNKSLALPEDIASPLDRADGRRVGGWPADTKPLELFDE